jgi:hypothetical protein
MNKRGSIQDLIVIGIIVLFFSMVLLIGFMLTSKINDQIQSSSQFEAQGKATAAQITSYFPGIIDNMFLIFMVGMGLAALILASLVRVHWIFIVFFIILLIAIIFFSAIFSNIYQEMASNSEMITYADQLTFTSLIMSYLPLFVGVFGFIMMIIMYKMGGGE